MKNYKINIEGMHCAGCARRVEAALKAVKGLKVQAVELDGGCARVSAKSLDEKLVKQSIEELGFEVTSIEELGA